MVSSCISSRPEFDKLPGGEWSLNEDYFQGKGQEEMTASMRNLKQRKERKKLKAGIKTESNFDLEVGENQEELEHIMLTKGQHYSDIYSSLDDCLNDAERKSKKQKNIDCLSKVKN